MKNNVIEILSYLFKKCAHEDVWMPAAHEEVLDRLRLSGISEENINQAFMWLAMLNQQPYLTNINVGSDSMRILDESELKKLGTDGYGFIIFLEKSNILNAKTREMVINQLMLLPQPTCQLFEIKWVVLVVLISCTEKVDFDAKLRCFALLMNNGAFC